MDDRAQLFIEVMVAIAIVGVLAFLVSLIARGKRSQAATADGSSVSLGPQWYVYVLAIILLVVVAALLVWELSPTAASQLSRTGIADDNRSLIFFIVMLVAGGFAVIVFLIYAFTRMPRPVRPSEATPAASGQQPAAGEVPVETSSGASLLGLFALALAFLLLNWIYVPPVHQYALMLYLIYPASIAVSLVLLFDKATRSWSAHGGAETTREWLFCDAIVFLMILGFVNLLETDAGENYAAVLWDMIYVVLFFFTFWIVDRTAARLRFLIAYAYMILLPVLLIIWRAIQGVELPEDLGWWSSVWPFFFAAIIFFVLEIIALIVGRDSESQSAVPAIKDGVFVVLYAVLLIIAVPGAEG